MMLRPSKHSHPDRTVIYLSMLLLKYLIAKRFAKHDALKRYARDSVDGGVLFVPSLDLLFLLGLIEYRPKTDVFEYAVSHEAV